MSRNTESGRVLLRPFCQSASTYGREKVLPGALGVMQRNNVDHIHCAFHNLSRRIECQTGNDMVHIYFPFHLSETHAYADLLDVS